LLESSPATQALPLPLKTACGSVAAGVWRIFLMPIDTSKTAMQVEGADGLKNLWNDVLVVQKNPAPLYQGAVASAAATAVGHFPWFLTYNFLNDRIPEVSSPEDLLLSLARAALLGLCASCTSDVCSNSLRVIKTTKQTAGLGVKMGSVDSDNGNAKDLSYADIVSQIIEKDGIAGLLGRGLQTRLLTNALQGSLFSVLWKYFQTQT
jgi:Mitochondrial carrier protein